MFGQSFLNSVWENINEACNLKYALEVYKTDHITKNTLKIKEPHTLHIEQDALTFTSLKPFSIYTYLHNNITPTKKDEMKPYETPSLSSIPLKQSALYNKNEGRENMSTKISPSKETTICLVHNNIQSLPNKVPSFETILRKWELNGDLVYIVCSTEHWEDPESAKITKLCGFERVSNHSRPTKGEHGGTCIYMEESLCKHTIRKVKNLESLCKLSKNRICEISAVQLSLPDTEKLVIICIYRPPYTSNWINFCEIFDNLLCQIPVNAEVILTGDINVNYLEPSNEKNTLMSLIRLANLKVALEGPTRSGKTRNGSTSSGQLDYIVTNIPQYVTKNLETGMSDHNAQMIKTKKVCNKDENHSKIRAANSYNIEKLCKALSKETWIDLYKTKDPDTAAKIFLSRFQSMYDKYIPFKKLKEKTLDNKRTIKFLQ